MSSVLVTGGAGFIGSHLTEALLQGGHRVRVLDDFSTGKRENLIFGKEYSSLELSREIYATRRLSEGDEGYRICISPGGSTLCSTVVEDPLGSNAVNSGGTLNILFGAREEKVKRVIYASSSSIYGDTPTYRSTKKCLPILSPPTHCRNISESNIAGFSRTIWLETVSLRYFNIFGPRQDPNSIYSAVIPKFIDALLQGSPPIIFGDGEQSRDFTYIGNVVQANLLAMSAEHLTEKQSILPVQKGPLESISGCLAKDSRIEVISCL